MEDQQVIDNLIIGETCLLNVQLRRLGLTTGPHNIFDNTLVNLDGVHEIISNDFQDMISSCDFKNYTFYSDHNISYSKFISSKYSIDKDNLFSWDVFSHFHTDSLSKDIIDSLERKIQRTKQLFENSNTLRLFYYYRYSTKYNIPKLKEKINSFLILLNIKYNKEFKFVLLTNNIVNSNKNLTHIIDNNINHFHFDTTNSWIGIDENWDGKSDNDLFDLMKERL